MTRWLVERKTDSFETVTAEHVDVADGCLVFSDPPAAPFHYDPPTCIIAAGQWLTCVPDEASA